MKDAPPIMLVDDSREDLLLIEHVLHQCKILNPVISCTTGDSFITMLERALQDEKSRHPVLVLVDLIMAPTSGLDIIKAMRATGAIKRIPVVMLSGIRDIVAIREGYQNGAQTFLIKPVGPEDIVQVVSTIPRVQISSNSLGHVLKHSDQSFREEVGRPLSPPLRSSEVAA